MSPVSRHHSSAPEVVDLAAELVEPGELVGAADLHLSVLGQLHVDVGVAVAGLVGVEFGEGLQGVGAQGVEQPVAVVTGPGHHRLLHQ